MSELDDLLARADALAGNLAEPMAGKDGRDGRDGKDGVDGIDGAIGERGPQGQAGKDGRDGRDGQAAPRPREFVFQVLRDADGLISGLVATAVGNE